jgi:hypothetical protein
LLGLQEIVGCHNACKIVYVMISATITLLTHQIAKLYYSMYYVFVVALLAKKGVCTPAEKAEFASRNIYPAGRLLRYDRVGVENDVVVLQ